MQGSVHIGDLDVTTAELYDTARVVGSVFQNPRSQFFCLDTTSELAVACENMGTPEDEIVARAGKAAFEMGIENLLGRSLFALSGGEKQKIACGSVSALHPDVFVLDEPSSSLDLVSIDDLHNHLKKWKEQGKTIVIAEHRLYWLRDVCDCVVCMKDGRVAFDLPMEEFAHFSEDDFRAHGLRSLNASTEFVPMSVKGSDTVYCAETATHTDLEGTSRTTARMILRDFRYSYEDRPALDIAELELPVGEVVAVASALLSGKELLVFDEPTSGMDFQNMERTAELLSSLRGKASVFVVTHDPDLVQRCCTQVLHLCDGKVVTA